MNNISYQAKWPITNNRISKHIHDIGEIGLLFNKEFLQKKAIECCPWSFTQSTYSRNHVKCLEQGIIEIPIKKDKFS